MSEYTIQAVEREKDLPNFSGGPAHVLKLTFESGEEAELFVMDSATDPEPGAKLDGTIEQSDFGPKFKKAGGRAGVGGRRSPADTKAIQRQHSQEMALRREANLIAAGHRPLSDEQMTALTTWFEDDIAGKSGAGIITGILTSDVPADTEGLP